MGIFPVRNQKRGFLDLIFEDKQSRTMWSIDVQFEEQTLSFVRHHCVVEFCISSFNSLMAELAA